MGEDAGCCDGIGLAPGAACRVSLTAYYRLTYSHFGKYVEAEILCW